MLVFSRISLRVGIKDIRTKKGGEEEGKKEGRKNSSPRDINKLDTFVSHPVSKVGMEYFIV